MTFPLFQLPLEIRLQIYACCLTSPTGYVRIPQQHRRRQRRCKIVVWDPESQGGLEASSTRPERLAETDTRFVMPDIELTILRASKQVFQECKGIFCSKNVIGFEEAGDVFSLKRIHRRLSCSIQHLMVPWDLKHANVAAADCLRFMRDWSRVGNLKSLTLIATYNSERAVMDILLDRQIRSRLSPHIQVSYYYSMYLDLLRETVRDGYFSHLERNIVVYSGHRKAIRVLGQQEQAPSRERAFLKELGDAFSASVWRDNLLCFRNGLEVQGAFAADPVNQVESPRTCEEPDKGDTFESNHLSQFFVP